ncbi:tetratricopeptide repeat protein [Curvibacter sp. HBC61]|uniref:Tetratricopeptide repeat protein n=1 Tax=Curvibacter cyanobacteriorum TaxID=3026422 RepID=A0ABT5N189_9BURK|nr:tetratricopeptide repeat-containing response regulator [Curvibacter sp. HBC61]MDD0840074.1 tetratricopeptide repeat protein [Curvibacter sp. HBC61]
MAIDSSRDIADTQALVIDGNTTSRSILVRQLRDYGVGNVVQCSRIQDARNRLEHTVFDFVLCEQFFAEHHYSGQTLLDDLRRAHLLPFATVFFMVTAEASYGAVAEAAESALDGYLLKPFTPSTLFERLSLARLRKRHLQPIFEALERQKLEHAADLCLQRFQAREPYWLYAARIGAELLLRLGRPREAEVLYKAVLAERAMPWARLGIARAQIEAGQSSKAMGSLQKMLDDDPSFADAYDVLGRAQVEGADFGGAMGTFRRAAELTPESVARLQKSGMMAYYTGDLKAAKVWLARATILGLNSKLYDFQSLVLLAFCYLAERDRRGLERCLADFGRIAHRHNGSARVRRFSEVAQVLSHLYSQRFDEAVAGVTALANELVQPDFDFEVACNLCNLLAVIEVASVRLPEAEDWVRRIGLRFANTRGLAELIANACQLHPPYGDVVRASLAHINSLAEASMGRSLGGDVTGAVEQLLEGADDTMNTKLLDLGQQILTRNQARIPQHAELQQQIDTLRKRCGIGPARAMLGQEGERSAGGVALRIRDREAARARQQESFAQLRETAQQVEPPNDQHDSDVLAQALRLRPT